MGSNGSYFGVNKNMNMKMDESVFNRIKQSQSKYFSKV